MLTMGEGWGQKLENIGDIIYGKPYTPPPPQQQVYPCQQTICLRLTCTSSACLLQTWNSMYQPARARINGPQIPFDGPFFWINYRFSFDACSTLYHFIVRFWYVWVKLLFSDLTYHTYKASLRCYLTTAKFFQSNT
jgi:hypothetical protein